MTNLDNNRDRNPMRGGRMSTGLLATVAGVLAVIVLLLVFDGPWSDQTGTDSAADRIVGSSTAPANTPVSPSAPATTGTSK